jgi:aspartate 1-decarboxylase
MLYHILKSKIHTVRVTEANIEYRGSITVDEDLMDAANIKKYEQIWVNNASNGSRIMTYVLPGERGSGMVCMNGGAALHAKEGDTVHLLTFCEVDDKELETFIPLVVFTDEKNHVTSVEEYR